MTNRQTNNRQEVIQNLVDSGIITSEQGKTVLNIYKIQDSEVEPTPKFQVGDILKHHESGEMETVLGINEYDEYYILAGLQTNLQWTCPFKSTEKSYFNMSKQVNTDQEEEAAENTPDYTSIHTEMNSSNELISPDDSLIEAHINFLQKYSSSFASQYEDICNTSLPKWENNIPVGLGAWIDGHKSTCEHEWIQKQLFSSSYTCCSKCGREPGGSRE